MKIKVHWLIKFWSWVVDKCWWMEKVWDFFRYDIPRFFRNLWYFKKILWQYGNWDFHYTLHFMLLTITQLREGVNNGYEVEGSRNKKVAQMDRVIELLKNHVDDNFIEQAEKVHGELILHPWKTKPVEGKPDFVELIDQDTEEEKAHNSKVFELSHKLENEQWIELWDIIKGNQENDYKNYCKKLSIDGEKDENSYEKWFNGTDARGWWD